MQCVIGILYHETQCPLRRAVFFGEPGVPRYVWVFATRATDTDARFPVASKQKWPA
jgi:hypothetical protein